MANEGRFVEAYKALIAPKLRHEDVCTLLRNGGVERDILTRKGFDVNMRLFESSPGYRDIILEVVSYIKRLATTEREGYKKPHGFSGANVGIPLNIIALADGTVMLNPTYYPTRTDTRVSVSNCGSLLLEKPITIRRYAEVRVKWFDLDGRQQVKTGYYPTEQHEVDHNNGILITDREAEK
jgi:peptide deformylase